MPKGVSLHIGLNRVDPGQYGGWNGQLAGCVNDARAMSYIASGYRYETRVLLDEQATSSSVISIIGSAVSYLQTGDIFFLSYSGHGGQIPDANGDEVDGQDETWVLFDRMLVDDELYGLFSQFEAGVRIIMLSDSCHSGTVARRRTYSELAERAPDVVRPGHQRGAMAPRFRVIPEEVQREVYQRNMPLYNAVQWTTPRGDYVTIGASVILISGCQDNQLSMDGDANGLFTETLMRVWNNGAFKGNYYGLWKETSQNMPSTQSPNYYTVGQKNPWFEGQIPFSVLQ
jgi:metacaspase-1